MIYHFDMEGIKKIYWRIGEVSKMTGLSKPTIRHYCKEFDISVSRGNKDRKFTEQNIKDLERVKYLIDVVGLTHRGVKKAL